VGLASPSCCDMEERNRRVSRRTFRWPGAARELVRGHLRSRKSTDSGPEVQIALKALISQVAAVSGNPRGACWRFVRQLGIQSKRSYRPWTKPERQKLLDLIASHSLEEVTLQLRRSPTSVRSMLHRLGANVRMGQDWFTKHALAEALRIRTEDVQKWIDRGWLKCRVVGTDGLKRQLIEADDFCDFCKQHRKEVVGNRLNVERLNFLQTFVFPPSHAELLPVRSAKKEQEAFDEQIRKGAASEEYDEDDEDELGATA
jgi:hypothetical protein